jgi:hypothetical protein
VDDGMEYTIYAYGLKSKSECINQSLTHFLLEFFGQDYEKTLKKS